jgi:hypothetical protein
VGKKIVLPSAAGFLWEMAIDRKYREDVMIFGHFVTPLKAFCLLFTIPFGQPHNTIHHHIHIQQGKRYYD